MATPQMNYALRHQLKLSGQVPFWYLLLQHRCLHHCPGVCLWCPGQIPSRGTKGNSSTSPHPRELNSRAEMRTHLLLDGSKGYLTMNSKEKQTETKNPLSHCRNCTAFFGESSSTAFGEAKTSVAVKAFTPQPSRAQ